MPRKVRRGLVGEGVWQGLMVVVVDTCTCSRVWVRRVQRSGLLKKVFAAVCCMLGSVSTLKMELVTPEVMACICRVL